MAKENVEKFLEHKTIVPLDENIEAIKRENRKKAKKLRDEIGNIEPVIITKGGEIKKASELTKMEQIDEVVRCVASPIYFIETYLTIFDQTKGEEGRIVPFKLFPFQKDLVESYENNRFNVANKYRQAGISTSTCAYISWYIMFKKNRAVAIVANKLETARDEIMADVVDFIDSCPEWLKPSIGNKNTATHKKYSNKSEVKAFSSKGIRGLTPTLIFWDETAWTERSDEFWTSARPTLQTGGRCIFVSTPNGLDPVFYKTFEGARKKLNNFNAVELWWWNDPRYGEDLYWVKNKGREDEIRQKDSDFTKEERDKLVEEGWEATNEWFEQQVVDYNGDMRKVAQELLCSFLGSGDNFVAEEYIKRVEEHQVKPPIREEWLDRHMWIWEDPIDGVDYVMPLDVASGHGDDYTSLGIYKLKEETIEVKEIKGGKEKIRKKKLKRSEQDAEYYGKMSPQQLAELAYTYGKRYNMAYCVIDVTGGYGVATIEKLLELGYENIHYSEISHKPTRDRLNDYIKTVDKQLPDGKLSKADLVPGFLIGQNRGMVLQEMERAIRMEDIIVRSTRVVQELKTFVTVPGNRVADHKRSFHDDAIMQLAMGQYAFAYDMEKFEFSTTKTKKMLDVMLNYGKGESSYEEKKHDKIVLAKHTTDDPKKNEKWIKQRANPFGNSGWVMQGIGGNKK